MVLPKISNHLPNPKMVFCIKVFFAVACPCSKPLVTRSQTFVDTSVCTNQTGTSSCSTIPDQYSICSILAEKLENPVESFGNTYSHQDPRRIWQISSVHCWSSTPAWLRCGGSLIIGWCEGKPRRFQREWKIFSGWSVWYKSAEVIWNHHEHGRIIFGSCRKK